MSSWSLWLWLVSLLLSGYNDWLFADHIARELLEVYPELAGSVKVCSALTFLTLLWTIFTLFELADLASPAAARAKSPEGESEGVEGESDAHNVYTMTWVELVMGTFAVIGWACKYLLL
jgi:hypothetical protein